MTPYQVRTWSGFRTPRRTVQVLGTIAPGLPPAFFGITSVPARSVRYSIVRSPYQTRMAREGGVMRAP